MTGRRLYEHYCDAQCDTAPKEWSSGELVVKGEWELLAWPFLPKSEKTKWNDLAKRITPRRRRARS
jgi:hypothetical protein